MSEKFVRSSWGIGLAIGALANYFITEERSIGVWATVMFFASGCSMLSAVIYMYAHQNNINEKIVRENILLSLIGYILIGISFYIF